MGWLMERQALGKSVSFLLLSSVLVVGLLSNWQSFEFDSFLVERF